MSKLKVLMCLLIGMIFMLPNCSARIHESEFVLGEIATGDSMDKVRRIYGEPSKSIPGEISAYESRWYTYYYGDGNFYVETSKSKNHDIVLVVVTTANNGIATKAGIKVGMTKQQLVAAYGNPDKIETKSDGSQYFGYLQQKPEGARVFSDGLSLDFKLIGDQIVAITLCYFD